MYDEHETSEHALSAELAALERQLASLSPAAPRIDRDRLMFAAGRASVQVSTYPSWAGSKLWPAATVLATAASVMLATLLVWQRAATPELVAKPQVVDAVVVVQDEPRRARLESRQLERIPSGYLGMRHLALTQGVGALDREPVTTGDVEIEPQPPATARQLLEELLSKSNRTS